MSPFSTSDTPIMTGDLVTPHDTNAVPGNPRWLRIGGAGDLALRFPGSAADITIAATAGEYVPVGPELIVRATGTTATAILALGV